LLARPARVSPVRGRAGFKPWQRVGELSATGAAEPRATRSWDEKVKLSDRNQPVGAGARPVTVPALLEARAAADADRLAIQVIGAGSLTFGEWHTRSGRVAGHLLKRGIKAGSRVGLIFDTAHWTDYAVAYCGAQRIGAVPVPVSPVSTAAEIEYTLTSCSASLVVSGLPRLDAPCAPQASFAELDHDGIEVPPISVKPEDLAQIIYTSGTSGKPKGVGASHANLTFGCRLAPKYRLFQHSQYFIHAFPLSTNAAQMMLLNAIIAHPSGIMLEHFDAERFCSIVEEYSVGTIYLVPSMAIELIDSKAWEQHDLSSAVVVASSGSALPQSIALSLTDIFPKATVFNSYTSTEAMPAQIMLMVDPDKPESAGFAVGNVGIRIGDDDGSPLPAGQIGTVWLRCPATPRFYFAAPEENTEIFKDGWVRMGDVGYLDDEGRLFLVDRESDIVEVGAMKVSTTEVESVLHDHPHVREAAVPHPVMGSMIAAAVVLDEDGSMPGVRSFLRSRLAPHKVPVRWFAVERLPRNQMGKVVKAELREQLESRRSRAVRA
jgi:acyl-CoA synthetase (AMP-forming)/AMP-acid ligase II